MRANVVEAIAAWLTGPLADAWDLLELSGASAADPAVELLVARLAARGLKTYSSPFLQCCAHPFAHELGSFLGRFVGFAPAAHAVVAARACDTGRGGLHLVESEEDIEQAFSILVDLHQQRRQSLGQQGCFSWPGFEAFHRDVAARFFASGRLRLLWLEIDGQPAAAEYSLLGNQTVYYYQGGIAPALADERPGWLCFAASLRQAIQEGYREFDFLRGDEPYKASWGATPRPLVQWRVVGRRPTAQLRFSACARARRPAR